MEENVRQAKKAKLFRPSTFIWLIVLFVAIIAGFSSCSLEVSLTKPIAPFIGFTLSIISEIILFEFKICLKMFLKNNLLKFPQNIYKCYVDIRNN